jgi:predicted small secreted protein
MMRKLMAILLMAGVVTVTGCNTMRGIGQDTSAAGDKLENSAEKNKKY